MARQPVRMPADAVARARDAIAARYRTGVSASAAGWAAQVRLGEVSRRLVVTVITVAAAASMTIPVAATPAG